MEIVNALRIYLAHAYYGTPPYLIPFKISLPQSLRSPLPPFTVDGTVSFCGATGRRDTDSIENLFNPGFVGYSCFFLLLFQNTFCTGRERSSRSYYVGACREVKSRRRTARPEGRGGGGGRRPRLLCVPAHMHRSID